MAIRDGSYWAGVRDDANQCLETSTDLESNWKLSDSRVELPRNSAFQTEGPQSGLVNEFSYLIAVSQLGSTFVEILATLFFEIARIRKMSISK